MDNPAVAGMLEAIGASALALAAELRQAAETGPAPLPDEADPVRDQADLCLDGLSGVARMEARLAAVKADLVAGFSSAEEAMTPPGASVQDRTVRRMSLRAEVAGALTVSESAAKRLLVESDMLVRDRPLTLAALQGGTMSWQHARIMCDETEGLDPVAAAAFEAHFLDPEAPGYARGCPAGELTPARFRAKARYWRERHHPVSIEKRHRKCVKDRRLEYVPDRDGMAWFSAYLPADQAAGIWNGATAAARTMQGPTETRTLTQLRVDAFAGWLLDPGPRVAGGSEDQAAGLIPAGSLPAGALFADPALAGEVLAGGGLAGEVPVGGMPVGGVPSGSAPIGGVPSPKAQVLVTVPVFSLLGLSDEPANLDGHGPIPPSMARRLVADGATSFLRVLVDPRDGAPLEIGRTSYRLTKPMRQWLRLRDAKCTFPNCDNHSLDNDADHILAWADGGGTGVANLGQPCPKHHRLKHATAWRPVGATRDAPPGWISPMGRSYAAEYQDWEPPTWPEPPSIQDLQELPPRQDWPERPLGEDWPIPPDWLDASELPEDLDDIESLLTLDGPEPPLPADPWPYWSSSTAA
ncbi:HNH endonuclease [Arthrobacter sp. FW305-BF8]|uniref:HNH endonuclease signature motif containing protein n=1 Tax=Arthrobacter sp. FW305-BF8 TaxID=2879617 RepID=UPI001F42DF62|nr:HNH endonuclease signature motif containing protein [Arthrobacter sp. FW305-BF8]UKA56091.1 HNH endonuclease [Arthrobacter sp. FW305-BF8]